MKNTTRLVVIIALMTAIILFGYAACDNDTGDINNSNGAKNLIGGTFESSAGQTVRFSVNEANGGSARSLFNTEPYPVKGQLQIGFMIFDLNGFYDPVSWNFTFSGASGNFAFEFFGLAKEGRGAGKLKIKNSSGDWIEELVMFEFDPSLLVNQAVTEQPAPGLPEKWAGIWECWGDDFPANAQLAEQWRTSQSGYMILTPHSIGFWFDIEEWIADLDASIESLKSVDLGPEPWSSWEEYRESFITGWYRLLASYSVLEVIPNSDGSFDVIVLDANRDWSIGEVNGDRYRKLRFQGGTGNYNNELWITFCTFDPDDPWSTYTDDITTARAGDDFRFDRDEWGGSAVNYTMFVTKRP